MSNEKKIRCKWAQDDALMSKYHDEEWGRPVHDDRMLFEMLTLEGAQAGLSWLTVLKKRQSYIKAFSDFDVKKVARFDENRKLKLMGNEGIVRNRLKIHSTVENAKAFLQIQKEFGSFDRYVWAFVGGKPIREEKLLVSSRESDLLSKDLKKRGFKFVGTTICYAFMQAIGMVNSHSKECQFK